MRDAIRAPIAAGKRDRLVLAMISYAHSSWLTDRTFASGLRQLGTDYADVVILGYFSKRPP